MARICIVAHFAFGALQGGSTGHVGGVERQTTMLARWLVKRGHDVSFITWDAGQPEDTVIDGIRLIQMCGKSDGVPGLRFFTPRWTSLLNAAAKADAELYYFNAAEAATGQLALWCRKHGRKFVYSVANDLECLRSLPRIKAPQARLFYAYGVRHADLLITQTEKQRRMLRENFQRDSLVLPMPCNGPGPTEAVNGNGRARNRVLWAARLEPVKRLEVLLDVAKENADLTFDVAAPVNSENEYQERVLQMAASLPNVKMHGRVPLDRMREMYRQAAVLCCTSEHEGFPNTFLEAWSWGLPVISTFDPDDLIARQRLGIAATKETLSDALRKACMDPATYSEMSGNARRYYLTNHQVDTAMARFERAFEQTIGEGARS